MTRSIHLFTRLAPSSLSPPFSQRLFSSTLRRHDQPNVQLVTPPSVTYNRPIGGIRAGLLGFLTGLTVTGTYAYLHLLEEYQDAANVLLLSVEELKASASKITNQVKRIEQVERDLKRMESSTVSKEQVGKLKAELKKLIDQVQIEQLSLKSGLSNLETDCVASNKSSSRLC